MKKRGCMYMNFASEAEKHSFNEKLSTVRDRLMPFELPLHSLFSLANKITTSSATTQPICISLLVHLSISSSVLHLGWGHVNYTNPGLSCEHFEFTARRRVRSRGRGGIKCMGIKVSILSRGRFGSW